MSLSEIAATVQASVLHLLFAAKGIPLSGVVGFGGGLVTSLTGAIIANTLTKRRERSRALDERRFEIYMKLIELKSLYFWFGSAEMHGELPSEDIRKRAYDLTWRIADMLRAADEIEYLEEILDLLLSPAYKSAITRDDALEAVINKLGNLVNPRYAKKVKEYGSQNILTLASGHGSNAPGAPEAFWRKPAG